MKVIRKEDKNSHYSISGSARSQPVGTRRHTDLQQIRKERLCRCCRAEQFHYGRRKQNLSRQLRNKNTRRLRYTNAEHRLKKRIFFSAVGTKNG